MARIPDIYKKVNFSDGDRARKSRKFIEQLTRKMIRNARRYCNEYQDRYGENDCPFIYYERSMYSSLAAAVASMTPLHLSEPAAERHFRKAKGKDREPEKSGRVDFWCNYNGVAYFIELKRTWMSIFGNSRKNDQYGNKLFIGAWNNLCSQVRTIKNWTHNEDKAVRIGIMVIYAYIKKSAYLKGESAWGHKDSKQLLKCIENTLDKKLKFLTLWNLPKDNQIILLDNDKEEFLPVIVFASTYEINKK